MNEVDKILKLADLGYTREEINKFMSIGTGPSELEIKPEEPVEASEPVEQPAQVDVAKIISETLAPYLASIEKATKAVQSANIRNIEMEKPKEQSIEEIMAGLVDSRFRKETK